MSQHRNLPQVRLMQAIYLFFSRPDTLKSQARKRCLNQMSLELSSFLSSMIRNSTTWHQSFVVLLHPCFSDSETLSLPCSPFMNLPPSLDEWRGPKHEAFSDHVALTVKGGKQRHGLRKPSFRRSTATPMTYKLLGFFFPVDLWLVHLKKCCGLAGLGRIKSFGQW